MRRLAAFVLLPALATSCSQTGAAIRADATLIQQAVDQWRGAKTELLFQVWGPPSRSTPLPSGGMVVAYDKSALRATTSHSRAFYGASTPQSQNLASGSERTDTYVRSEDCSVTFYANEGGTIERTEATGSVAVCRRMVRPMPVQDFQSNGTFKQEGDRIVWQGNGQRGTLVTDQPTLPSRAANPSPPLTGRWKFTKVDCWGGSFTQYGRLAMQQSMAALERYVIDFDQNTAETKSGACIQHKSIRMEANDGRWKVHFYGGSAEGCAPLPEVDRVMEIDSSGVLLDHNYGKAAIARTVCAAGDWVQVFAPL
jgi:hypothetical protein